MARRQRQTKEQRDLSLLFMVCIMLSGALVILTFMLGSVRSQVWDLNDRVTALESVAKTERVTLDAETPITARWIAADGSEVLAPEAMPLWRYVQEPDEANHELMWRFFSAFEADLHAGDATFHRSHELIDGQEW